MAHVRIGTKTLVLGLLLSTVVCSSGCINLAANLIHAIRGNKMPAEYDGLEDKRVVVVCATDEGLGTSASSSLLTSYIHVLLNTNLEDTDLVRQEEVEQWLDTHGWSDADYVEIGKGVKSDLVVAVDVLNLSLKDGATLYRGQCDLTVSVFDINSGGKLLFRKQIPEFSFPTIGGTPITDTSEAKFRGAFLEIVAHKVAELFYGVDPTETFALDATAGSF